MKTCSNTNAVANLQNVRDENIFHQILMNLVQYVCLMFLFLLFSMGKGAICS